MSNMSNMNDMNDMQGSEKKGHALIIVLCIVALMIVGGIVAAVILYNKNGDADAESGKNKENLKALVGGWSCRECPEENEDIYVGYLCLSVEEDGAFSMYDAEAGNPGIEGTIKDVKEDTLVFYHMSSADFDPPSGWENLHKTETITYKLDGEVLKLSYDGITLVFDRTK